MSTPQDTVRAMRREIAKLVDDNARFHLTVGAFSELIGMLNDLDEQLAQGAPAAVTPHCPECGPLRPIDTQIPALVRAVQTCMACPSQWDAWDASGQYYYLRFRSGLGSVEIAESAEAYVRTPRGEMPKGIASFEHGDRWAGELTLEEFLAHAGIRWEPA